MKRHWPLLLCALLCGLAGMDHVRVSEHPIGFILLLIAGRVSGIEAKAEGRKP